MPQIKNLSSKPKPALYRRADGTLCIKANDVWYYRAAYDSVNKIWKKIGKYERIDPDEEVTVVSELIVF